MVELVVDGKNPLAIEARAAAYIVDPIDLDRSEPSVRELILVRYAKPPVSGNFVYKMICAANNGPTAMWADCVSDDAGDMDLIAGFNISHLITALQVVRLCVPANFDLAHRAKHDREQVRWTRVKPLRKTNGGNEFFLNFDIVSAQVAEIPLKVINDKFVVDRSNGYTLPPPKHTPLQPATYKVTQDHLGTVECVLT